MQRRKFSREFKLEAVRLVEDRGVAVAQAPVSALSRRAGPIVGIRHFPRAEDRLTNAHHCCTLPDRALIVA